MLKSVLVFLQNQFLDMSIPMEYSSIYRDSQTMDNLEKQLICPVCLEMFTKPVVILPCQHNLCRKCANDIFQSRGTALGSGGCFRCPSCHQEIILDRHGVYGLQRNLLVENIIDIYKQESLRSTSKPEQPTCEEHDEEKINIYCISCETPTCSLCKVFGVHKACEVAPLLTVYKQQKCQLGDGIGALVAANDTIQTFITHLEEMNKNIEDNCRSLKQTMYEKFDSLFAVLETKKQEMLQIITNEQDEKISHCKYLIKTYSEHIQSMSKLVKSVLQSMEEPQMAVFLRNAKKLTAKVSEATRASVIEELEHGYENMDHYHIDLEKEQKLLQAINFLKAKEKSEVGVEEAAAGEKQDCEIEAKLSQLSATGISEVFVGVSAIEGNLSSSSELSDIVSEVHEKEDLSAKDCSIVDDVAENEELRSGSSGMVVTVTEEDPRAEPSNTDDEVSIKDELSMESRDAGDELLVEDPNAELSSAVDDISEKEDLSTECSSAGIEVHDKEDPNAESPNVIKVLRKEEPKAKSFAVDEIPVKDKFSAESDGARTETPEKQTGAKSSVAEADALEKKESSIEPSSSVISVPEDHPNAEPSIAVDEFSVQEELGAQSDGAWDETIDEHPSAESLATVALTFEKESSLEPSGSLVNVPEDNPRAESSTTVGEGLVKEELSVKSDDAVPKTLEEQFSVDFSDAGSDAPERKESYVESSGSVVNVPEGDLSIESSTTLSEVPVEETLTAESLAVVADSPEEKVSNVESSGSVVNVPEVNPNVESSNNIDDIPEKEELGSKPSGAQINVPERDPSAETSNTANEVPPKEEPNVESASIVNDVSGKEEVNTESEVTTVEVPLKEESSAASPSVSDGALEARASGAVFPDIVDTFPGVEESNETPYNIINANFKMGECSASTPDTRPATRKECIPRSPDQISEIEKLMDKSSVAISPVTMIQELIAAPSGTANVSVSVVESITSPCRASLESVAASPGPTDGIFPSGESKIPFTDIETGKAAQEKTNVGLSETTAQQGKLLSGNCNAGDLKMPQLLAVVEDDTKLYPGWHKCGSWHVLKSTMLVTSPNPGAASHDLSAPSSVTENLMQPEASCVAIAAGSPTVIKTPGCENTVQSPITKMESLDSATETTVQQTANHELSTTDSPRHTFSFSWLNALAK